MGNNKMNTMTCGVLITDGQQLLICHPTNSKFWDIPKGKRDGMELIGDTAVRELREETGIELASSDISYLRVWDYKPGKVMALFSYRTDHMPDPNSCVCVSTFEHNGRQIPEMDRWAVVSWPDAIARMNPDLARILSEAKDLI